MSTSYRHPGDAVEVVVPALTTYTQGQLVIRDGIAGIIDLPNGTTGAAADRVIMNRRGVFEYAKTSGIAFTYGQKVYYNATADEITTSPDGNTLVGVALGTSGVMAAAGAATELFALLGDAAVADHFPELGDYAKAGRFRAIYDFATDGGVVGANEFGPEFPDNSYILEAHYEVQTTFTSPTGPDNATIAMGVVTDDAAGLVAAVAINAGGNPWDAAGAPVDTLADGTAANATTKTTAAGRKLALTVAVEAITAGRLVVTGSYGVGE